MATFENRGKRIRVKIEKLGVTESATFDSKREAQNWAKVREAEIISGAAGVIPNKSFGDLLEKYAETLDADRRRADKIRITRIVRDDPIAKVNLRALDSTNVAEWRDRRLKQVSAASVLREWNILSPACKTAIKEWRWLQANPFAEVKRPTKPESRDRRISEDELRQIRHVSGYDKNSELTTITSRVCAAFLFAIETGMRIGEICNIKRADIHEHYIHVSGKGLGGRKTRNAVRDVPLSVEAERIVATLLARNEDSLFCLSSGQNVDAVWRMKIIGKTTIDDLHFHDSRHEAITRLARKLNLLDLARMVGIVDLKTLMVYYNPTGPEISRRLKCDSLNSPALSSP